MERAYNFLIEKPVIHPDKFNNEVESWAAGVNAEMKYFTPKDTGALTAGIEDRVAQKNDIAYKVIFSIPHHGYYVRWGAGKGVGGAKGSRWMSKNGWKSTKSSSLNKLGKYTRSEQDFYNPVIDKNIDDLGDIAARYYGDVTVNSI